MPAIGVTGCSAIKPGTHPGSAGVAALMSASTIIVAINAQLLAHARTLVGGTSGAARTMIEKTTISKSQVRTVGDRAVGKFL
jgi:hypothetical protein